MKQIIGAIIFMGSLGVLLAEVSKGGNNISQWGITLLFILIGIGLEMVIIGLIDDAKTELRNEIQELRDKIERK